MSSYQSLQQKRSSYSQNRSDRSLLQQYGSLTIDPTVSKRNTLASTRYDGKKATVISYSELERIKARSVILDDKPSVSQEKKKGLWGDRIKKDYERKKQEQLDKFIEKEEELRKIDAQEEQFRQIQKKTIIHSANQKIFDNDPRVREFKRRLLYSDVVQEQENLNEIRTRQKQQQEDIEQFYDDQIKTLQDEQDAKDYQEQQELKKKREAARQMINQQVKLSQQQHIDKIQNDKIEQQIIKDKAEELQKQEQIKKQKQREKHRQLNKELSETLQEQNLMKKRQQELERIEDQKIDLEKKQKEQIQSMKEQRIKQMQAEVRIQRQTLIDQGIKRLAEFKSTEDKRIQNQIVEVENQTKEKEAKKQRKLLQLQNQCDISNKQSLQNRQNHKQLQINQDQKFIKQFRDNMNTFDKLENDEKYFQRQKEVELKQYHQQQVQQKQQNRRQQMVQELNLDENIKSNVEVDKRVFNSWAESLVNEYQQDGKNITPIIRNMDKIATMNY